MTDIISILSLRITGNLLYRAFMEDAETPTVYGGTVNTAGKVSVSGGVTYLEAQTVP